MSATSSRFSSSSDVTFIASNYALTTFTYSATMFTWIRTAAQFAALPHLVAIGIFAGFVIRGVGEMFFKDFFGFPPLRTPESRFLHRLAGAITSLPVGILLPLKTVDPFYLGMCFGWMIGSCFQEYFFTNADSRTGKPNFFGV